MNTFTATVHGTYVYITGSQDVEFSTPDGLKLSLLDHDSGTLAAELPIEIGQSVEDVLIDNGFTVINQDSGGWTVTQGWSL